MSKFEYVLSLGKGEIAQSVFEFVTEYESRWCFVASKACSRAVKCCKWMVDPRLTDMDVMKMDIECINWHFQRYDIGVLALHYVPDDRITLEMCDVAIRQDSRNARWLPKGMCCPERLLKYVKNDGWVFGNLSADVCTIDLARAAIKFDPNIFKQSWAWNGLEELREELSRELIWKQRTCIL